MSLICKLSDPIAMETDPESEPRVVRRRLEDHLGDDSPSRDDKSMTTESEEDVRMDYREIGETYREYFV